MNISKLLEQINQNIKTNGSNAITGSILNAVLQSIAKFADSGTKATDESLTTEINKKLDALDASLTTEIDKKLDALDASLTTEIDKKLDAEDADNYILIRNMIPSLSDKIIYPLYDDANLAQYFSEISKVFGGYKKVDDCPLFDGIIERQSINASGVTDPKAIYFIKSEGIFAAYKNNLFYYTWTGSSVYGNSSEYNNGITKALKTKIFQNFAGEIFFFNGYTLNKASLSNCTTSEKVNFAIKEIWLDDGENRPYVSRLFKNLLIDGQYRTQLTISQIDGTIDCQYLYNSASPYTPNSLIQLSPMTGGKSGYAVVDWSKVDDNFFINNDNTKGILNDCCMYENNIALMPSIYAYILYNGSIYRGLFEAAGAVYNPETGLYSLSGLDDLTETQILESYVDTILQVGNYPMRSTRVRTFFPIPFTQDLRYWYFGASNLESVQIKEDMSVNAYSIDLFCCYCKKLKKVLDVINVENVSRASFSIFSNSPLVEYFRIKNLNKNAVISDCPLLTIDTVSYLVDNAANTSAITVQVHPDVYAKLTDSSNTDWYAVNTAAQAKQISFATTDAQAAAISLMNAEEPAIKQETTGELTEIVAPSGYYLTQAGDTDGRMYFTIKVFVNGDSLDNYRLATSDEYEVYKIEQRNN